LMDRQQMADVLASAWVLATAHGDRGARPLPTGQGVLDRALKRVTEAGHFTDDFRRLRFVETRLGTRCPELRAILTWAQATDQSTDPNPSYKLTKLELTPETAHIIVKDLGLQPTDAEEWGIALAKAVDEEVAADAAFV
jgi:hypothetical protein